MTDVRQQLTAALDRAEREFKHEHTWTCAINAEDGPSCDCGLSELMARLVERDRALLAHHQRIADGRDRAETSTGRTIRTIQLEPLEVELQRAAAFWVGTPEVDHG